MSRWFLRMEVFKRPLLDICVWLECLTFMVFNHVALCEMPLADWLDGVFGGCRGFQSPGHHQWPCSNWECDPYGMNASPLVCERKGQMGVSLYTGIRSAVIKQMNERER